jgi:hypothetical protein
LGNRKHLIQELIIKARQFQFCSPSDDPDEQTAVTLGYKYLVIQFQQIAGPYLPEDLQRQLNGIRVDPDYLYTAYQAKAELDGLIPDIEDAIEQLDEFGATGSANMWIVAPEIVAHLEQTASTRFDTQFLARLCQEINSCWSHGNVIATALLMRSVLNYVPPIFGHTTFAQVTAQAGRSLKESFDHLENGLRKVADFQTHRIGGPLTPYPSVAQVEPFKPQFELLMHEILKVEAREDGAYDPRSVPSRLISTEPKSKSEAVPDDEIRGTQ